MTAQPEGEITLLARIGCIVYCQKLRKRSVALFSLVHHPQVLLQPSYDSLHSSFPWSIPLFVLSGQHLSTV